VAIASDGEDGYVNLVSRSRFPSHILYLADNHASVVDARYKLHPFGASVEIDVVWAGVRKNQPGQKPPVPPVRPPRPPAGPKPSAQPTYGPDNGPEWKISKQRRAELQADIDGLETLKMRLALDKIEVESVENRHKHMTLIRKIEDMATVVTPNPPNREYIAMPLNYKVGEFTQTPLLVCYFLLGLLRTYFANDSNLFRFAIDTVCLIFSGSVDTSHIAPYVGGIGFTASIFLIYVIQNRSREAPYEAAHIPAFTPFVLLMCDCFGGPYWWIMFTSYSLYMKRGTVYNLLRLLHASIIYYLNVEALIIWIFGGRSLPPARQCQSLLDRYGIRPATLRDMWNDSPSDFVVLAIESFLIFTSLLNGSVLFSKFLILGLYIGCYLDSIKIPNRAVFEWRENYPVADLSDDRPDVWKINEIRYQRSIAMYMMFWNKVTWGILIKRKERNVFLDHEMLAQILHANIDHGSNTMEDVEQRANRIFSTLTTVNRRKDLAFRYPTLDQDTKRFFKLYIKHHRQKSAMCKLTAECLNL
jgi:hypothetical protein